MIINENTITGTLPPSIDKFLMDMSQMYIDDLSYNDISKFGDRATEEDVKQLRKYKRELSQGFEEDDPEIQEIFKSIKSIVKGLNENMISKSNKMILNESLFENIIEDDEEVFPYEFVAVKTVYDSNGFTDEYHWYRDRSTDKHYFYFGEPMVGYEDWECDSFKEAQEWFDNYKGFEDEEELNEGIFHKTSQDVLKQINKHIEKNGGGIVFDAEGKRALRYNGNDKKLVSLIDKYHKLLDEEEKKDTEGLNEALHGTKEINEFFQLCKEIGLETFGDLERFAEDNKNRIIVNNALSKLGLTISNDAFFETLRDYKKEILGDEDFEYDDPLNVVNKLKRTDESMENKLNKQEVLDWISEHDLAWEDFVNYFEDIYQSSAEVLMDEIMGWISDHDDLAEDFENKFGVSVYADVYDDFSEEEIEEHLAIDRYDQINSPNILEINTTKHNKLKESVESKWNIGSNKLVSTDSQEYANLVDLAKLLQERSPNGYEYRVEKTYEDFGAGMQWYTIICDEKNGWGTHQVLNPAQWIYLANTGDVEGTYQDLIADKYFRDKLKTDRTASLFTYMNNLDD